MIKVSVLYANKPGARFDHGYYREKHVPLIAARLGSTLRFYEIDKGIAGDAPGTPAPFVAIVHLFSESLETFQAGFGPHAEEIIADIRTFTDVQPIMQVSEVVVVSSAERNLQ